MKVKCIHDMMNNNPDLAQIVEYLKTWDSYDVGCLTDFGCEDWRCLVHALDKCANKMARKMRKGKWHK